MAAELVLENLQEEAFGVGMEKESHQGRAQWQIRMVLGMGVERKHSH